MEEKETESLGDTIKGYKEKVPIINKGFVTWEKDLVFTARIRGYMFEYDPTIQEGCFPTDTFLMSIPGCLGLDVFVFLQKMRAEIKSFDVETIGERNPTPPQYYKSVKMIIHISGKGITPKKLDRAIALSQKKYCSVHHSIRKDMDIQVSYNITEDA
jgi:putative redox protein